MRVFLRQTEKQKHVGLPLLTNMDGASCAKVKVLHSLREINMGGMLILVLVLASCFSVSKAEVNLSDTVNYKTDHLVFSLLESSESLCLCNGSSSNKSSSSLFASHQMPNGAVLDLCLESSGRLCCEFLYSSKVSSFFGLELMESERKLLGNGAHRELRSLVTVKLENIETCNMVIVERLSSGVFADKFELEGLVARGVYAEAVLYGDHNLELPALHSSQSMVVIHKSFSSESKDLLQAEVRLPLHARYPPLSLESHVAVGFRFPILLLQCFRKGGNASNENMNDGSIDMAWALLTKKESSLIDSIELQWRVPAGNPLHSKIVASITACTSFIGVVTLWVVSKYSYQVQKIEVP